MSKYRVTLMSEIDVEFKTPEKTYAYFVDGAWKDSFFTFCDLDDMAEHLVYSFDKESDTFISGKGFCKDIEGFPIFLQDYDKGDYYFDDPECGEVRVKWEMETDVDDVEELEE